MQQNREQSTKSGTRRLLITLVLLAAAVALITIGAVQGEMGQVLQKAANICLECIGIG